MLRVVEPPGCSLIQHLALEGDGRKQAVKRTLPVVVITMAAREEAAALGSGQEEG